LRLKFNFLSARSFADFAKDAIQLVCRARWPINLAIGG
jgi:hypothetical protein